MWPDAVAATTTGAAEVFRSCSKHAGTMGALAGLKGAWGAGDECAVIVVMK